MATHKIDKEKTVMIGDNINTDICFGKNGGIGSVLVMTGVFGYKDLENGKINEKN